MRLLLLLVALPALILAAPAPASPTPPLAPPPAMLDIGFRLLYETKFEAARSQFLNWESQNPQDPLGHAWEAASYLFEELYQKGVLSSQYFLDGKRFLEAVDKKPDGKVKAAFFAANTTAQQLARQRLKDNPRDEEALFTMAVTNGMLADYDSLLDNRQLESLTFIREAESYARTLLAVKPDIADAYLPIGVANYIIGSLPAHKRFFLWLDGIKGDKELGLKQLKVTATQGYYLRPFAKIMLGLAALREKQVDLARTQLEELNAEFPQNPSFAHELALLRRSASEASGSQRSN